MAFAWIPKATVQAALGGLALLEAQKRGLADYIEWSQAILTTAVFAVIITAPLGAIMINTLGTKWLIYDGDDPEIKKAQTASNSSSQDAIIVDFNNKKKADLEDSGVHV